jgi:hypothetical protein
VDGGLLFASADTGTGAVRTDGSVVVPLVYTKVAREDKDVLKVFQGERFGYVRIADGEFLWKEADLDSPAPTKASVPAP